MVIGKNYLLPKAITEAGIDPGQIMIDDSVWPLILRPLGFDAGIRSLARNLQGLARKVARQILDGKTGPFKVTDQNVAEYLPG